MSEYRTQQDGCHSSARAERPRIDDPLPCAHRRAFTLIELLVVVAVITLLVAILLPSLQAAKRRAKALVCRSNLRQWGAIFHMYTSDNSGMLHNGDISDFRHLWMEALWPYYNLSRDICQCPMASQPSHVLWKGMNEMGTTFTAWSVFTGNYAWDRDGFAGSYGINGWTRNPPEDIVAQYHGNFPTANNCVASPAVPGLPLARRLDESRVCPAQHRG
jgi:prepilin-type N-terminal cleavage/methylation domain-containing protein